MIYLELFLGFLQVGCFTFGGAYGAIPLIRDVVLSRGWLTDESLTYMIAVSESTPGPIMVNMATYIGSSQGGFWGALLATAAVVLPSFCIILLVMVLLNRILDHPWAKAILRGLKPCIIGIILATGLQLIVGNVLAAAQLDIKSLILTAVLTLALIISRKVTKKGIQPIALIVISAVLGMIVFGI